MEKIYTVISHYDADYTDSDSTDVFFTEEDARNYVKSTISKIKEDFEENCGLEGAPYDEYWDFVISAVNRDYSFKYIGCAVFEAKKGAREIKEVEQKHFEDVK